MRAFIEGVGLLGPGLGGWQASKPILTGALPYRYAATAVAASELLPPAERRRTGTPVKLALAVGYEAFLNAGRDAAATATVFATSSGDGETLHQICESLASAAREVSPTRFHNSVHNAAAGYWGIATRSREASTTLCCYDGSFSLGLLEAVAQAAIEGKAIGLIAYDQPYPEPLHSARPLGASLGVALVVVPEATERALAAIEIVPAKEGARPSGMSDAGLEEVRSSTPAGRSLPLLAALARQEAQELVFEYIEGMILRLAVAPCR